MHDPPTNDTFRSIMKNHFFIMHLISYISSYWIYRIRYITISFIKYGRQSGPKNLMFWLIQSFLVERKRALEYFVDIFSNS